MCDLAESNAQLTSINATLTREVLELKAVAAKAIALVNLDAVAFHASGQVLKAELELRYVLTRAGYVSRLRYPLVRGVGE